MLNLSDLIIYNPQVNSFNELIDAVRKCASDGEIHLQFDVKPDYRDTPRNWEWKLERAFYQGDKR
ncbi:MAG: sulfur relay protein DsrC [Rhodospirillaceae bacterium]|jgi:hypothetical protein|nr:sulfur relay protein DsrC [Rhodospirillaceae bacterium]MBT5664027.1 sulfur relay protein DsrC [Rhodospirillaceae bacterium]MBT5811726.1 sulfur relay protein DsrC [Rhodospirillaceae bacterium]